MNTDTIIALCTAPGLSALALLRLDGPHARVIADAMAARSGSIVGAQSHSIVYGHIIDGQGAIIDQVLFLVMQAPRTFTGNDVVEITGHNNKFIIEAIISRALALGARVAQPGEFAQRAVMNGKLDLLQAEALHELITAPSRALVRASLAQLNGSLSQAVVSIEQRLFELAAFIEASFEFSEEEHLDLDFDAIVRGRIADTVHFIEHIEQGQSRIQQLRDGVMVALIGAVNVGKSTMLNTLLGRQRAIVSDRPGTTRDSIEAGVTVDGYSWTYVDTAGLRSADDLIEQEGIVRSREAAAAADLVLLLIDGSVHPASDTMKEYQALIDSYGHKMLVVLTKSDVALRHDWLAQSVRDAALCVSAHTGDGIILLRQTILQRVMAVYQSVDAPFILNQRQLSLITQVAKQLAGVQALCGSARPQYELVAAQVHQILRLVTELSGRSVSEQVMDKVFSTFCIGK